MEHAKTGGNLASSDIRSIILRREPQWAYDIYSVNYMALQDTAPYDAIDSFVMALSTRDQDQEARSTTSLTLNVDFWREPGIFAVSGFYGSLNTEGLAVGWMNDHHGFPRPFRVPYAALLIKSATSTAHLVVGEVFFERVRVSGAEYAQLVAEAGGRARTAELGA